MKINYSINHNLIALPMFEELKNQERQALIIMLSCITHFVINAGYCDFYKGMMAKDWGINIKAFAKAEKILIAHDYLKILKYANKAEKTPARYTLTPEFKEAAKVYCSMPLKVWNRKKKTETKPKSFVLSKGQGL